MSNQQVRAFNRSFSKIVPVLTSSIKIQEGFDPKVTQPPVPTKEYNAIWDTGATRTAITSTVAQECGLKPTGMCKLRTAGGEKDSNTYFVSVYLPNGVCLPQLRINEAELAGADVLIGMDIIGHGDFAVTNHEGKTNMSFRIPSVECIDFVKQQPPAIKVGGQFFKKVGRNDPCPCGSAKKYKKCCGR